MRTYIEQYPSDVQDTSRFWNFRLGGTVMVCCSVCKPDSACFWC